MSVIGNQPCRAMQAALQEAIYIAARKADALCMVHLDCTVKQYDTMFCIADRWTDVVVATVEATTEYNNGYRPSYSVRSV